MNLTNNMPIIIQRTGHEDYTYQYLVLNKGMNPSPLTIGLFRSEIVIKTMSSTSQLFGVGLCFLCL